MIFIDFVNERSKNTIVLWQFPRFSGWWRVRDRSEFTVPRLQRNGNRGTATVDSKPPVERTGNRSKAR